MRKIVTRTLMAGASAAGAVVVLTKGTGLGRVARRAASLVEDRTRYLRGALPGLAYRATGREPASDVPDEVLCERVRAELGRVEHRLDVPRVRVAVQEGVVVLHGAVPTHLDAHALEWRAHRVPGVRGVESYLQVMPDATRPSDDRSHHAPSHAHRVLVEAARTAGVPPGDEELGVRAVLVPFLERLPLGERNHVLGHLPADVELLVEPPRRHGPSRLRTRDELDDEVARIADVDALVADALTTEVLGALRSLVPEETDDVAAVLPANLKDLWAGIGHAAS
jgi:uncharacterized protein (DUF2267 family)